MSQLQKNLKNLRHPSTPQNVTVTSNENGTLAKVTCDPVDGAKSYVIEFGEKTQALDELAYTTTNSAQWTGSNYPGKTYEFRMRAFPQEFEGADEKEKAEKALASGLGSEPSTIVEYTFPKPVEKPGLATEFKATDTTYNSTKFSWKAPEKGLSCLLFKGDTAIAYKETLNHTFTDDSVAGTTQPFSLQYFDEKFTGTNDQEKIDKALASGRGGDKTVELEVTFPLPPVGKATNLQAHATTSDHTTIDFTAPAGFKSAVVYADDKAIAYIEEARVEITDVSYAGKTVNFAVECYNEPFKGKDNTEQMNNAIASERGGGKSDVLPVEFPAEKKTKARS